MQERICKIAGCENLGEVNKKVNGKKYRRPLCTTHNRERYGKPKHSKNKLKKFKEDMNNTCQVCSWVGPCDVHRLIPRVRGGKYIDGNIICICPNCHRLHHQNINILKKEDFETGGRYERYRSVSD